jgi:hypothetical protein
MLEPPAIGGHGHARAHQGLKEVLMGSNTADVIKRGGIPVLAVQDAPHNETPERIMVADDGGVGTCNGRSLWTLRGHPKRTSWWFGFQ